MAAENILTNIKTVHKTKFHTRIPVLPVYSRDPFFIHDCGFERSAHIQFVLPGSQAATLPPQLISNVSRTDASHKDTSDTPTKKYSQFGKTTEIDSKDSIAAEFRHTTSALPAEPMRVIPAGPTDHPKTADDFIMPGSTRSTLPPNVPPTPSFSCKTCTKAFHQFEPLVAHMFHEHVTDRVPPCKRRITATRRVTPYPLSG